MVGQRNNTFFLAGILLLVILVWASPFRAQAQGKTEISYDTTIEGIISADQPAQIYAFSGQAGDTITVLMETLSGDLDPLVEVLRPDGTLLISNDDISTNNTNALTAPIALPAPGRYQIIATRYDKAAGSTTGTFNLTLEQVILPPIPDLDITYETIGLDQITEGHLEEAEPRYYLFYGAAADIAVAILTPLDSAIVPDVRFYDTNLNLLSESFPDEEDGDASAYYVLPEAGWVLIRIASQGSSGAYELETVGIQAQWIEYGANLASVVSDDVPNNWYVFNARYGDQIMVEQTVQSGDLLPYTVLADNNLNDLTNTGLEGSPATLTYTIPRTDQYVLLVGREDLRSGTTTGDFALTFDGTPFDIATVNPPALGYGRTVQGAITDEASTVIYHFQGKQGDVVTLTMRADDPNQLDPYLALTDADLNELAANDDTGAATTARIFQYQLPATDQYYVLATRYQQAEGSTTGTYTLEIQTGEVELSAGAVEVTLRWNHEADLDLFVRDPNGDLIAWDNPTVLSGGELDIDTNANCETVTALPLEHAYWPQETDLPGIYEVQVWYQLDCESKGAVTFDLRIAVGGEEVSHIVEELTVGERYEMSITVDDEGSGWANDDATITQPNAHDIAAQLVYGEWAAETINDDQPTLYYEFEGQEGDRILITADQVSGDLDPYLILRDATGEVLIEDDDSGGDLNAAIRYTLPATGMYEVAMTHYEAAATSGEFLLSLEQVAK